MLRFLSHHYIDLSVIPLEYRAATAPATGWTPVVEGGEVQPVADKVGAKPSNLPPPTKLLTYDEMVAIYLGNQVAGKSLVARQGTNGRWEPFHVWGKWLNGGRTPATAQFRVYPHPPTNLDDPQLVRMLIPADKVFALPDEHRRQIVAFRTNVDQRWVYEQEWKDWPRHTAALANYRFAYEHDVLNAPPVGSDPTS